MKKTQKVIPQFSKTIIETHCHLDYLKAHSYKEIIEQAKSYGVEKFITVSVSPDNLNITLALSHNNPSVWCSQGIHPHDSRLYTEQVLFDIKNNINKDKLSHNKVVAIGEIGLDYYYENSDRKTQIKCFKSQLELASDYQLPVIIHSREADEDMLDILTKYESKLHKKGVIHSFTSGEKLARWCIDHDFKLGFNGIATFNKASNVRDIIQLTPLENILLETDAPYLTPVPFRGKENAPCYLPLIAEAIANVKQIDIITVLEQCYQNSLELFF